MAESKMVEFKMVVIIKLSQNKWMKFIFVQNGWFQDGKFKMADIIKLQWDWMSLSQIELVWVRVLC